MAWAHSIMAATLLCIFALMVHTSGMCGIRAIFHTILTSLCTMDPPGRSLMNWKGCYLDIGIICSLSVIGCIQWSQLAVPSDSISYLDTMLISWRQFLERAEPPSSYSVCLFESAWC